MRNSLEVAKRIEEILKEINMKPSELANKIGVDRSTISRYFSGDRKIPMDEIPKIANAIDVNASDLLFVNNYEIKNKTMIPINEDSATYAIPKYRNYRYIPTSVSAGLPIEIDSITNYDTIAIADELLGKHAGNKNVYFMRVNGDSMNNLFPHNSLIAVLPQTVEDIKDGDIVVYSHNYDYSVKTFYRNQDELIFKSNSNNPKFHDYVFKNTDENLRIHGKVILYIVNVD